MKRVFIITEIERFSAGERDRFKAWSAYRVQMCHDPNGIKAWDSFQIPTENFGDKELPVGTKFTLRVLAEAPSTDGLDAEELEAAKVGVDLRRARDLKQELEEELGRAGLKMELPARKCLDVLEAIELFEANLSDREVALDLLAIAQDESLVWPLDG